MITITEVKGSITLTAEMMNYLIKGKKLTYHIILNGIDFAIDLQRKEG